ncbi:MAG: OB-fold nucleic acid binding domain-containing protein [Candidatus Pacearchaeota archaeon]
MDLNEAKKRHTAYRFRIGQILKGKPEIIEDKFVFLDIEGKKVVRVNVIANVVEKFVQEGEKKYASVLLDDGSGQIRMKLFGEDIIKFNNISGGDSLRIIGLLRYYNGEIYISPEIMKKVDPLWLRARMIELQREKGKEEDFALKDKVLSLIKEAEKEDGISTERLISEVGAKPKEVQEQIKKLLEEGMIYEPRPGKLRYLG